jgi:hypothetical protein
LVFPRTNKETSIYKLKHLTKRIKKIEGLRTVGLGNMEVTLLHWGGLKSWVRAWKLLKVSFKKLA